MQAKSLTSPYKEDNNWYKQQNPHKAPKNWATKNAQNSFNFNCLINKKAKDTAGFNWAPEICPNPEASPTIKKTKIKGPATGTEPFNTAAPQPT